VLTSGGAVVVAVKQVPAATRAGGQPQTPGTPGPTSQGLCVPPVGMKGFQRHEGQKLIPAATGGGVETRPTQELALQVVPPQSASLRQVESAATMVLSEAT
jgi:hypothetical protein